MAVPYKLNYFEIETGIDSTSTFIHTGDFTATKVKKYLGTSNDILLGDGTTASLSSLTTLTSFSATSPLLYNNTTGVFSIPVATAIANGYLSSTDWTTFNNKQNAITLTTTGSSGASTFISNTLNVPNYTLSGLGGVPTSRQLTINGTAYDLSADRSWSVGTVTSVGLSMPAAFSVASSPVTGSGTIAVTGAGLASQYIRGDGQLADFPTGGGGGGSSVSYYLNGSVNQGTFVGNTYYEMNKTPVLGAGTDFNIAADGYIAQFITDANDPNSLLIPGGNWNLEFYFSASSGGGTPSFYAELYKYDGTTFTLIADNSANPELIAFGTTVSPYFSPLAVPETVLLATDRLAIRIYVNASGRTITLHTENSNLCQVITTFTTGLQSLNGLTKQTQFFSVGTSGTDFNISSATDTHTFNIPSASDTNRGLVTTGTQTFAGEKTFFNGLKSLNTLRVDLSSTPNTTGLHSNTSGNGAALYAEADTGNAAWLYNFGTGNAVLKVEVGNLTGALATFNNTGGQVVLISNAGNITANSFIKSGGTSSQFLKADGSVDGTAYGTGTVTSVSALTLGTSGTDLSSTVANGTTTPVITLNVPTASATNRGALSSTDWTTFNSKQDTITLTTTGTSGAATFIANTLNIPQYQSVLTNPVTGTGTSNEITYWTGSSTVGSLSTATYPSLTELSYVKGVTSAIQTQLNAKQGTLTLTTVGTSGAATLIGSTLNIPNYADGGVLSLSAIGSSPNANGGTITGTVLNLEPASASFGGVVTTGTQTFAGDKTFTGQLTAGTSTQQTPVSFSTNSQANQPALTIFKNVFTGTGEDVFKVQSYSSALSSIIDVLTVKDSGATAISGALSGTSGTFSGTGTFGTLNSATIPLIGYASTSNIGLKLIGTSTGNGNGTYFYANNGSTLLGSVNIAGTAMAITNEQGGILYFATSGSEQARISSSGDFSIGTSTGGYKLNVNGTGNFSNALSGTSATFTAAVTPLILKSTSATTMWTEYYYNTSTLSGYIGSGSGILSGANNSDFIIRSEADFVVATGGNNRRLTVTSGGNVLIGTTSDNGAKLQVSGNTFISGFTSNQLGNHGEKFISLSGPNSAHSFDVATQFPSLAISGNVLGVTMFITIFGSGGSVQTCIATIARNSAGTWASYGLTASSSTVSLLQSVTGSGTTITINTNSGSYVGVKVTAATQ